VSNLHRNELHTLVGETRLHEDGQPTQEMICGFILNETRTMESAGVFPVLGIRVRTVDE
jgi:hypothetical protein